MATQVETLKLSICLPSMTVEEVAEIADAVRDFDFREDGQKFGYWLSDMLHRELHRRVAEYGIEAVMEPLPVFTPHELAGALRAGWLLSRYGWNERQGEFIDQMFGTFIVEAMFTIRELAEKVEQ